MALFSFTPQLCADLLVGAFFLVDALRWRWRWSPLHQTGRGTTLVYWGCYVTTLLALNFATPAQLTAETPVGWLGVMAAAVGLARMLATLAAVRTSATQSRGKRGHPDVLGNLVFWIGAATASLNVIAILTVVVAMLAATGVRLSVEAERSGQTPTSGAWGSSGK